jgi:hypothetical protein
VKDLSIRPTAACEVPNVSKNGAISPDNLRDRSRPGGFFSARWLLSIAEALVRVFSDVAAEHNTIHTSDNEPPMATAFQADWLSRPPLLWIERNQNNGDALVTFSVQLRIAPCSSRLQSYAR